MLSDPGGRASRRAAPGGSAGASPSQEPDTISDVVSETTRRRGREARHQGFRGDPPGGMPNGAAGISCKNGGRSSPGCSAPCLERRPAISAGAHRCIPVGARLERAASIETPGHGPVHARPAAGIRPRIRRQNVTRAEPRRQFVPGRPRLPATIRRHPSVPRPDNPAGIRLFAGGASRGSGTCAIGHTRCVRGLRGPSAALGE
jgi:hypothetical protein